MAEISKEFILSTLESRFDYSSTRITFRTALDHAGLADKKAYTPQEIIRFCDSLRRVAVVVWDLDNRLRALAREAERESSKSSDSHGKTAIDENPTKPSASSLPPLPPIKTPKTRKPKPSTMPELKLPPIKKD